MKQTVLFLTLLVVVIASAACAPSATPTPVLPTLDAKATETQIAFNIFATQTASVPTVTNTPTNTSTPQSTATPLATPTLSILELIPTKRTFNHTYTIETSYDKFRDVTSVVLKPKPLELNRKPNTLIVAFTYAGTTFSMPKEIIWDVGTTSRDWQFLSVKQITFLLDNNVRLNYAVSRSSDIGSGYVYEWLEARIPLDDFLKMVNSKAVALQASYIDADLSNAQLEALRDLASRLNPVGLPTGMSSNTPLPTATATPEPDCGIIPKGQGGIVLKNLKTVAISVRLGDRDYRINAYGYVSDSFPVGQYRITISGSSQSGPASIQVLEGQCAIITLQ